MARPATEAQEAALESLHRVTRIWIEVHDGTDWVDLTDYLGEQWVSSATWDETNEKSVIRVRTRLLREGPSGSLAPLVQADPLLAQGADARLAVSVSQTGEAATPRVDLLEGQINKVDWGGDDAVLEMSFREGTMARITHASIDEDYELSGGTLSASIQEVIDEFVPGLPFHAESNPPGTFDAGAVVPEGDVIDGMYHLVDQTGWELRRRWVQSAEAYQLVLFEPDNPTNVFTPPPVLTLDPIHYYQIDDAGFTSAEARDRVLVRWSSPDGETVGTATAQTDEPLFGPDYRTERFDVRGSDLIVNQAAADEYAELALLALGRIPVGYRVVLPFDWRPEIGDWVRLSPNGIHHTANWNGAIIGIDHQVEPGESESGGGQTILTLAGTFGGRISKWIILSERTRLRREIEDALEDEVPEPPAPPGEVAAYYTQPSATQGFDDESERDESLGKYISTTRIELDAPANVFRELTAEEIGDGTTQHIIIAIANTHGSLPWPSVRGWVDEPGETGVEYTMALDPAGLVDLEDTDPQGEEIADIETAPTGYTFTQPEGAGDGLVLGDVDPQKCIFVGLRRTTDPGITPSTSGWRFCFQTCYPGTPQPEP